MDSINFDLLKFLSKCSIEFGILNGEGEKLIDVDILNTDDTITTTKLKVADIMYFTEYGTVTIPGKHLLEKSLLYIRQLLNRELEILIPSILDGKETETSIRRRFYNICLRIQDYVRNYMATYISNNNRLGNIINEGKDENKYIFDLSKLSKYIRCVPKFEN